MAAAIPKDMVGIACMGALVDEALLGVWGIVLLGIHAPWKLNDYHQNQNRNQHQMYAVSCNYTHHD